MNKIRVLAIAEAANPEWASVPLVGWSLATALREVASVHIVTQVRNRAAFERAGLVEGEGFTSIDSEKVAKPVWKLSSKIRGGAGVGWTTVTALNSISYSYFEHLIWRKFGRAIAQQEFDLVHRITPLSPTTPSLLARRCRRHNVPFVVGPLNGGVPWPKSFENARRREREWLSYVRGLYKLVPGSRSTFRSASAVIVGSRHTQSEIAERHQPKTFYIPENGITSIPARAAGTDRAGEPLRACFIGRFVPYKGPDMALEAAVSFIKEGRLVLELIGDGPLLADLKSIVARHGIEQGVIFRGWLAHEQVGEIAARCSIMLFPSVREFGGGVVLEAMARGVVPIVVDYGGPGELVTSETGFKVAIRSRREIVADLKGILAQIIADPGQLTPMASHAKDRITDLFLWSVKARQVRQVYDWVLRPDSPKPAIDF